MVNVIKLNVVMLNVVFLSVVMLIVVAQFFTLIRVGFLEPSYEQLKILCVCIEQNSSEIFFLNFLDIWYSLNILKNNYIISDNLKRFFRHIYFTILRIFVRTHFRKFCEYGPKNGIHKANYKNFMSDFRA